MGSLDDDEEFWDESCLAALDAAVESRHHSAVINASSTPPVQQWPIGYSGNRNGVSHDKPQAMGESTALNVGSGSGRRRPQHARSRVLLDPNQQTLTRDGQRMTMNPILPEEVYRCSDELGDPIVPADMSVISRWIYPNNYSVREYQMEMVRQALFRNSLVCLPTGLGKTLIAAVVMFNYYRWFPTGKIVFMAPTKPLVAQQVEACHKVVGIPQKDTAELGGHVKATTRVSLWNDKRVFFCTPQTFEKDLENSRVDARQFVLLVVDEAHKATGKYAYTTVVRRVTEATRHVRILALSATPGKDLDAVQNIVNNLRIAWIGVRDDDDSDVKKYMHARAMQVVEVRPTDQVLHLKRGLLEIITHIAAKVRNYGVEVYGDLGTLNGFCIMQAYERLRASNGNRCGWHVNEACITLQKLLNAQSKLMNHGLEGFKNDMYKLRDGKRLGACYCEVVDGAPFRNLLRQVEGSSFSHPKLVKLEEVLCDHFRRMEECTAVERRRSTRAIVFTSNRDSIQEIVNFLDSEDFGRRNVCESTQRRAGPLLVTRPFYGQGNSAAAGASASANRAPFEENVPAAGAGAAGKSAAKGMTQKRQKQQIKDFFANEFNVMVATSIAEEGLDIGEVDLIVCFDAVKSPIRMIQRIGRTGRKRSGNVVVFAMQGKEYKDFSDGLTRSKRINKQLKTAVAHLNAGLAPAVGARSLQMFSLSPVMLPRGMRTDQVQMLQQNMVISEYRHSQVGGHKKKKKKRADESDLCLTRYRPDAPSSSSSTAAARRRGAERRAELVMTSAQRATLGSRYSDGSSPSLSSKSIERIVNGNWQRMINGSLRKNKANRTVGTGCSTHSDTAAVLLYLRRFIRSASWRTLYREQPPENCPLANPDDIRLPALALGGCSELPPRKRRRTRRRKENSHGRSSGIVTDHRGVTPSTRVAATEVWTCSCCGCECNVSDGRSCPICGAASSVVAADSCAMGGDDAFEGGGGAEEDIFTWQCGDCGTECDDTAVSCVICGAGRPCTESQLQQPGAGGADAPETTAFERRIDSDSTNNTIATTRTKVPLDVDDVADDDGSCFSDWSRSDYASDSASELGGDHDFLDTATEVLQLPTRANAIIQRRSALQKTGGEELLPPPPSVCAIGYAEEKTQEEPGAHSAAKAVDAVDAAPKQPPDSGVGIEVRAAAAGAQVAALVRAEGARARAAAEAKAAADEAQAVALARAEEARVRAAAEAKAAADEAQAAALARAEEARARPAAEAKAKAEREKCSHRRENRARKEAREADSKAKAKAKAKSKEIENAPTERVASKQGEAQPATAQTAATFESFDGGDDGDVLCGVCGEDQTTDEDSIVFCDGVSCDVAVHMSCYGLNQLPKGDWFCEVCRHKASSSKASPTCVLCGKKRGAMKRVHKGEQFAHAVCATYLEEIRFTTDMRADISELYAERRSLRCELCDGKGGQQCEVKQCRIAVHPYCALTMNVHPCPLLGQRTDKNGGTRFFLLCQLHTSENGNGQLEGCDPVGEEAVQQQKTTVVVSSGGEEKAANQDGGAKNEVEALATLSQLVEDGGSSDDDLRSQHKGLRMKRKRGCGGNGNKRDAEALDESGGNAQEQRRKEEEERVARRMRIHAKRQRSARRVRCCGGVSMLDIEADDDDGGECGGGGMEDDGSYGGLDMDEYEADFIDDSTPARARAGTQGSQGSQGSCAYSEEATPEYARYASSLLSPFRRAAGGGADTEENGGGRNIRAKLGQNSFLGALLDRSAAGRVQDAEEVEHAMNYDMKEEADLRKRGTGCGKQVDDDDHYENLSQVEQSPLPNSQVGRDSF